jgi:hypothetical protein
MPRAFPGDTPTPSSHVLARLARAHPEPQPALQQRPVSQQPACPPPHAARSTHLCKHRQMRRDHAPLHRLPRRPALGVLPARGRPRPRRLALGRERDPVVPLQQPDHEERRLVVRKLLPQALHAPLDIHHTLHPRDTRTIRGPALNGMNTNGFGVTWCFTRASRNRAGSNTCASSPQNGLCRCASIDDITILP